jgi:hypothetical protein
MKLNSAALVIWQGVRELTGVALQLASSLNKRELKEKRPV